MDIASGTAAAAREDDELLSGLEAKVKKGKRKALGQHIASMKATLAGLKAAGQVDLMEVKQKRITDATRQQYGLLSRGARLKQKTLKARVAALADAIIAHEDQLATMSDLRDRDAAERMHLVAELEALAAEEPDEEDEEQE